MSLRRQLLAFGLLTLFLPWSGFRYVQEMEAALRSGLERSLIASATTVAASLQSAPHAICAPLECGAQPADAQTIYAHPLRFDVRVDGVLDDWAIAGEAALTLDGGHRLWTGVRGRYVYLYIAVRDEVPIVYQRVAGEPPYGDRLVLLTQAEHAQPRWLLLATAAPGQIRAQQTSPGRFEPSGVYDDRIESAWQETSSGYSVEVRLPLADVTAGLGVAVIDVDRAADGRYAVQPSATWPLDSAVPGAFVRRRPELTSAIAEFDRLGGRFRVLDGDGWILAEAGDVNVDGEDTGAAPLNALLRFALEREDLLYPAERPAGRIADRELRRALAGEPVARWYRGGPGNETIVAAAVPIGSGAAPIGAVLLEQASDSIQTATNQALARLMTITLVASIAAAAGLLGYATVLSLRVRRLAHAAETALGPKGEIRSALPGRGARDEIGDLARSFEHLLERLRGYTQYLRTLSSKLSHELRTPLAVVSTSLENLEHEPESADAYIRRMREGTQRLDAILAAMSEATRLEQAIAETPVETFDLNAVLASCCDAYKDVYPERRIVYTSKVGSPVPIAGSADLVAQLLDKLVDNAVSFSPKDSEVAVQLAGENAELVLSVTNKGSRLPEEMRDQLFDSLVSVRERSDGRPHLGLGLHIVALIAAFHGGRVGAFDLPDGTGVIFKVWLPRPA